MIDLWWIPIWPLLGFLLLGFFGRRLRKSTVAAAACGSVGLAAVASLVAVGGLLSLPAGARRVEGVIAPWIQVGNFQADWGLLLDPLSAVMVLVVSVVGFLIHVYAVGYMHDDQDFPRFFTYLNLFTFSMLMLVLANNYLLLYVFWEAVGLCSYLLIGFWFERPAAAGKKAFIVNRVGDFGFGLGVMLLWTTLGTLHYEQVFALAPTQLPAGGGLVTAITLLLFLGATGKSAQLPLYVWLPDAMEGPTPVSALIHAATMVTAGVYMVARSSALFNLAPLAMGTVAWIGALTAVFAASIALVQTDIKRVVAYSTISQLGYMFLGCGVGAYASAIFHLATHAFFKALLFLGSGSVIHALGGEQDIRKMGQLKARLPHTSRTFYWAALANAGIIPLAGFWSKDEILAAAFAGHRYLLWALGSAGAFMTAFYMFRLYYTVFEGKDNLDPPAAHQVHESPPVMTYPLLVLGAGCWLVGALFGFPPDHGLYHRFVEPVFAAAGTEPHAISPEATLGLAAVATAIAALGIWVARAWYKTGDNPAPAQAAERHLGLYRLLWNKWYVDELYTAAFVEPIRRGALWLWQRFDEEMIDGCVNEAGEMFRDAGQLLRRTQSGYVMNYVLGFLAGVVVILGYLAFRG
ncbi:MAG: NADH-quinone oxidoreductase subunit L [candidate division NC10 bacterium]|nr:NADH-quinone oxidoreductase subunit L [candidate division NC10 bacterium]